MYKHFLPSVVQTIAQEEVLDHKTFSLLLPRGDGDTGDIIFGDYDKDLSDGVLSTHPFYPGNATDWTIEATSASVSFLNGTSVTNQSFEGYTAILKTNYPWLVLPPFIGQSLVNATGADCSDSCTGCEVPCDEVTDLPVLTLNFGGHDFTIGGWDYTVKTGLQWPFCGYKEYCTLLVCGSDFFDNDKKVLVGSSFMKNLYSVYDTDERNVKCRLSLHSASSKC